VKVGSAELFFALVNVQCRIVYEVWATGAREIEPKKQVFASQEQTFFEISQAAPERLPLSGMR